jgi:hypothetical protein
LSFFGIPSKLTIERLKVYDEREMDASTRRKLVIKQKRQIESSLVKLNRVMQQERPPDSVSRPFDRGKSEMFFEYVTILTPPL